MWLSPGHGGSEQFRVYDATFLASFSISLSGRMSFLLDFMHDKRREDLDLAKLCFFAAKVFQSPAAVTKLSRVLAGG